MELFEVLFILLFILFPVLDALRRGKKQRQEPPLPQEASRPAPGQSERGADPAAEMLPDDLWEVLTGERRPPRSGPGPAEAWEEELEAAEAAHDAREARESRDAEADLEWGREEEWTVAGEAGAHPVRTGPGIAVEETSSWDAGLEARPRPKIVSLEQPLQTPDVRHRRFHEKLAQDSHPAPSRHASWIGQAMRERGGLRRAIILKEVLGPPKGLD